MIQSEFICRLCGNRQRLASAPHAEWAILGCVACGFKGLHPLPDEATLAEYYTAEYWAPEAENEAGASPDRAVPLLYRLRVGPVLSRLGRLLLPRASILDVGCGDGDFVRLATGRGYRAIGIDKHAPPNSSPLLLQTSLHEASFADESFDGVTMFHFLEHVSDPVATLAEAARVLRPGGVLLVEAPNGDALGLSLFGSRWQPVEAPTHLNFFSPETLTYACRKAGVGAVERIEQFSLRASPAALALSVFPSLHPRGVRRRYGGRYPKFLAGLYVGAQAASLSLAVLFSVLRRGCIFRVFARKLK